jgi:hypothetical protein
MILKIICFLKKMSNVFWAFEMTIDLNLLNETMKRLWNLTNDDSLAIRTFTYFALKKRLKSCEVRLNIFDKLRNLKTLTIREQAVVFELINILIEKHMVDILKIQDVLKDVQNPQNLHP